MVSQNILFLRRYSRKTYVHEVIDYADTDKITPTLSKNYEGRLPTDFKGTLRWKKIPRCVSKPNSNNLKMCKHLYLKKNLHVHVVHVDMQFSNFTIEYLFENEKVRETVFACSYVAQVESWNKKKLSKISWHCFFKVKQLVITSLLPKCLWMCCTIYYLNVYECAVQYIT